MGQKGAWPGSRDLLLNFGTPLLSPVRMRLQTSNFAAKSRVGNTKQKKEKLGQKGAWPRSRDLLLNFGTPLLSPVRMKLQTSDFAAGSRVGNTKEKKKNWAKKGRGVGHVTYF